jgi:uncharacterized lipoprotein YmbA
MTTSRRPSAIRGAVIALAVSAPIALGGCLGSSAPRDHFYRINLAAPASALPAPVLPGTLEVERLRTDALTRERAILRVPSADSLQVSPSTYHLWIDTPTVMLQRSLAEYLRLAGVAERVVVPEMNIDESYELSGWIERLVHVRNDDRVIAELEFSLTDPRGTSQLLRRRYRAEVATGGDDMDKVVAAFNAAIGEIFARLVADIAASQR